MTVSSFTMGLYESTFLGLIVGCGILTWQQYRRQEVDGAKIALLDNDGPSRPQSRDVAKKFTRLFLVVYMLVMGADWLQGPYVYALYKNELGFPEKTVAALFTTGFLSGAVSGYFVGSLADRYGRRTACLTFCVTYSMSCLTILYPSLPALFLARVLGGLSTSLLYSAFESWMVTEFHKRELDVAGHSLSSIFGIMTTMNSITAIIAGVFSEWLVGFTDTKKAPFIASAVTLTIAFCVIRSSWSENYGSNSSSHSAPTPPSPSPSPSSSSPSSPLPSSTYSSFPPAPSLRTVLLNPRIIALGLASAFFEGSMYLFVFFWTPALISVASASNPALPLGLIFASFMASIMLGSILFTLIASTHRLIAPARLLTIIFAISSSSLLIPVVCKREAPTFAAFCVFEACVGLYFPAMGYLKGRFVDDGMRARIYGVLRIPLNIFVVGALACTREGEEFRDGVWVACSALLIVASGVAHWVFRE